MDLGECPKIHDLALRADFELASKTKDYFYDIDVSIYLLSLVIFFNKLHLQLWPKVLATLAKHPCLVRVYI